MANGNIIDEITEESFLKKDVPAQNWIIFMSQKQHEKAVKALHASVSKQPDKCTAQIELCKKKFLSKKEAAWIKRIVVACVVVALVCLGFLPWQPLVMKVL